MSRPEVAERPVGQLIGNRRKVRGVGTYRFRWWIVLLIAGLVGCQGSDSEAPTSETSSTVTATTIAAEATPTTLATTDRGTIEVFITDDLFFDERIIERTDELFTANTGISVEYITGISDIRELLIIGTGPDGPVGDVWHMGSFEAPQFGANDWLYPWDSPEGWDDDDVVPSVLEALSSDGKVYGVPIQAESSFIVYRADVLEAAGLTMPDKPTWGEVAEIARTVHNDDMAGICWQVEPGWNKSGAVFTSMLNTFGGTWWTAAKDGSIDQSQVNQPEFRETLEFYVGLATDAGPPLPDDAGCQDLYQRQQVAIWYATTSVVDTLETEDSAVRGLNGYALSPVEQTDSTSWMNVTALAIPQNADDPELAREYLAWVSGPDPLSTDQEGGDLTLAQPRYSNYNNPDRTNGDNSHEPYLDVALRALETAPVTNPGLTPRPGGNGVQYVGVREFHEIADLCSEQIALALTGEITIADTQARCHEEADRMSP